MAAAVLSVAALGAGVAQAQAPTQDSAVGDVIVVDILHPYPPVFHATFEARSGPSGENPTGSVRVVSPLYLGGFIAEGSVTCLTVTGNRATIGFTDTDVQFDGDQSGFLFVEDNGTAPLADRADFEVTGTPTPSVCPVNTIVYQGNLFVSLDSGLTVVDAPPLPTSKEQCKNGGYTAFGFKSQGQCVAFVERGPKP